MNFSIVIYKVVPFEVIQNVMMSLLTCLQKSNLPKRWIDHWATKEKHGVLPYFSVPCKPYAFPHSEC